MAVHAIGDKANAELLDAIDELAQTVKGDRRWRIEHGQIVDPADLPRFGAHGIVASMQPIHETSDWQMAEARMGAGRLGGAYAWRSMLDNHVPLRSEEHTSELQSLMRISYAVFCLTKKKKHDTNTKNTIQVHR